MTKPSIPKGTRDFLPDQMVKRKYLFNTIEKVFKKYGFLSIETPVMENLSTLTGKYGDEGDKLLFKILNNGDFLSKADEVAIRDRDSTALIPSISKRGLRYDLTVPFARFVAMHRNEIQLPFKRYQIQPVWRADRPQKGRYQEFYQCDVDVVGSPSLMYEAEMVQIFDEVFHTLGIEVTIKVNNRKVLNGIAEVFGIGSEFGKFAVIIDKLDKIGLDRVQVELLQLGLKEDTCNDLFDALQTNTLQELRQILAQSKIGLEGIEELEQFHDYFDTTGQHNQVILSLTLARGLSYYTGCIFEVLANDVKMGSIGGGGRYANLTETFGLPDLSGVGISFGAERIYDVMEELNLFDQTDLQYTDAIFLAFDQESHLYSFAYASKLRSKGIPIDIYPEPAKMKKQLKYANNRGFKFAIIVGEEERTKGLFSCKNLETGEQSTLHFEDLQRTLSTS